MTTVDPNVGWYEYRGARFELKRCSTWGSMKYHVGGIKLPWLRGSAVTLSIESGWYAWSVERMFRKIRRVVDRQYRDRERNGKPTSSTAWADEYPGFALEVAALAAREDERTYEVIG